MFVSWVCMCMVRLLLMLCLISRCWNLFCRFLVLVFLILSGCWLM